MAEGVGAHLDAESKLQAQWGFLKNIVNIDTFFASGPHSAGSRAEVGDHRRSSLASQLAALDGPSKDAKANKPLRLNEQQKKVELKGKPEHPKSDKAA